MVTVPGPAARRLSRYAEALLAMVVALLATYAAGERLEGTRLLLLWMMSLWVAWRDGLRPVTLVSILGVLLWDYYIRAPIGQFATLTSPEVYTVVVYVAVSIVMGRTFDSLRAERIRVVESVNGMLDAMFVLDARGRLLFYNAAGKALAARVGVDAGKVRGQVLWKAVPQLVGTVFETEPRRAKAEGRTVEFEARYPDADLWVQVRAVPSAEGGMTLFAHDISAREHAVTELRRSEQRYRALVEASTVLVWSTNAEGMVSDVPVWHELTGQTTEELRGVGWLDALHPDDRRRAMEDWTKAEVSGTPYEIEYRLRQRDGTYRWFRVRAVPVKDGDIIREWVGVLTDIHEQHAASVRHTAVDNALGVLGVSLDYEWNLAAVTRLLVPALADYCSVDLVDLSGVTRRVSSTHVDPAMEGVLRESWPNYPYLTDDTGASAVIRTGVAQLSPVLAPQSVEGLTGDAEEAALLRTHMPRSFLCVPMNSRGQVFGALSLVFSSSGRSHSTADQAAVEQVAARAATAIENARLYAEAQAASRAKSDFLATMSHELRTPLNAIAGYADLLMMGVRGPVTENQMRDLGRIHQNQQHLLEIITDILNFSRIEAGRLEFAVGEVDVRKVLERMEGVIEPQARARSIEYSYTPPTERLAVIADREKLEQVLINLLGNAVKFTPAGGTVSLGAESVDSRVRIMVRDTGIGIPREQLESVFEPFVQLEPALTRTAEGTGLGLAISRELTRGMGGELHAESTPGEGSIFYVELPRAGSPKPIGD